MTQAIAKHLKKNPCLKRMKRFSENADKCIENLLNFTISKNKECISNKWLVSK